LTIPNSVNTFSSFANQRQQAYWRGDYILIAVTGGLNVKSGEKVQASRKSNSRHVQPSDCQSSKVKIPICVYLWHTYMT